jgi:hypothetical protein
MSRTRLIVSLLAVLAVGIVSAAAAASASASASETRFFVEGKELTETRALRTIANPTALNFNIAGDPMKIMCIGPTRTVHTMEAANGMTTIEFERTDCTIVNHPAQTRVRACANRSFTVTVNDLLPANPPGGIPDDMLTPVSGKTFLQTTLENEPGQTCTISGTYTGEGSYIASWGPEAEVEKSEHELTFTSNGSSLTVDKEPASLTTEFRFALENQQPWSIR